MLVQLCCLIVLLCTKTLDTQNQDVSKLKNVGYENGLSLSHEIKKGEFIQSKNKEYTLVMQLDCNFVLYVCNF